MVTHLLAQGLEALGIGGEARGDLGYRSARDGVPIASKVDMREIPGRLFRRHDDHDSDSDPDRREPATAD